MSSIGTVPHFGLSDEQMYMQATGRDVACATCSKDCMWKIIRVLIFHKNPRLGMPVQSPKYANEPALIAMGSAIRKLRLQQKVSQEELAHRAALDRSYMSSVERGVQNPGVMIIVKIASALNVSVAAIFAAAGM